MFEDPIQNFKFELSTHVGNHRISGWTSDAHNASCVLYENAHHRCTVLLHLNDPRTHAYVRVGNLKSVEFDVREMSRASDTVMDMCNRIHNGRYLPRRDVFSYGQMQ